MKQIQYDRDKCRSLTLCGDKNIFNLLTFHCKKLAKSCHSEVQISEIPHSALNDTEICTVESPIAQSMKSKKGDGAMSLRGAKRRSNPLQILRGIAIATLPLVARNDRTKKAAFTLAETLITIGIIGVVSALTIPNLMNRYYEKQTVAKLKETYSILSQALRMAEEEYGDVSGWDLELNGSSADAEKIAQNLKPYLKVATDCGINDSDGKCIYNGTYKILSDANWVNYANNTNYYKLSLLNGTSMFFRSKDDNRPAYIAIFVDTNAHYKPNTFGRDLFTFKYEPNVGLRPTGAPDTEQAFSKTCNKNSDGSGCAYYVLKNERMDYLR
ncbi:type II secretion system protein [bacterium]|nr:type II secretion system protein [bacterium]